MAVDLIDARLNDEDEKIIHRHEFTLLPRLWREYPTTQTFSWNMVPLSSDHKLDVPEHPGVYTLLVQPGIAGHPACSFLMYVGRAKSLRSRFHNYLSQEKRVNGRPKIFRLLHRYPANTWFCFATLSSVEAYSEFDLYQAELSLYNAFLPPCNDMIPARPAAPKAAFPNSDGSEVK